MTGGYGDKMSKLIDFLKPTTKNIIILIVLISITFIATETNVIKLPVVINFPLDVVGLSSCSFKEIIFGCQYALNYSYINLLINLLSWYLVSCFIAILMRGK